MVFFDESANVRGKKHQSVDTSCWCDMVQKAELNYCMYKVTQHNGKKSCDVQFFSLGTLQGNDGFRNLHNKCHFAIKMSQTHIFIRSESNRGTSSMCDR